MQISEKKVYSCFLCLFIFIPLIKHYDEGENMVEKRCIVGLGEFGRNNTRVI